MDKNYLDWNKFIKFESGLNCTTHQLNYLNTLEKLLHQAVFKTVGAQTRERRVRWWKKMTLCLVKSEKNRIVIWSYYYMVFWSSIVQITANSSSLWYFISWCWLGATFPRGFWQSLLASGWRSTISPHTSLSTGRLRSTWKILRTCRSSAPLIVQ